MNRQLMRQTQVMVNLSLNVITKTNGQEQLVTMNLIRLTTLIFWLWSIRQGITRHLHTLSLLLGEVRHTLNVSGTVFAISVNSLAFGLGVSL